MAVAQAVLNETQRTTLEALCDTFVPAVDADTGDPVEKAFMARAASDLAVAAQIEGLMADVMVPDEIEGFAGLLDALAAEGFAARPWTIARRSCTPSATRIRRRSSACTR